MALCREGETQNKTSQHLATVNPKEKKRNLLVKTNCKNIGQNWLDNKTNTLRHKGAAQ